MYFSNIVLIFIFCLNLLILGFQIANIGQETKQKTTPLGLVIHLIIIIILGFAIYYFPK